MPHSASMRGAYRSRKDDADNNCRVPQSFAFFPREGMAWWNDIMKSNENMFSKQWVLQYEVHSIDTNACLFQLRPSR